jgi:hypothetical protein
MERVLLVGLNLADMNEKDVSRSKVLSPLMKGMT